VHTLEVGIFDFLGIDQLSFTPESDFGYFVIERVDTEINLLMGISVDLEVEGAYGDLSIRVYGSIHSEAEDIFG